jgi:16S rRNA processing protein RimM
VSLSDNREYCCIGVIVAAHGIKGWVKVKSFTEDPASLFSYGTLWNDQQQAIDLQPKGSAGGALLAALDGVEDRTAAELLKGTKLYIPRDTLPSPEEGEFYIDDLLGLKVRISDGREVGQVAHIANYGAGDVIEIKFNNGTEEMFSFTDENFPEVRVDEGYLLLVVPEILEAKK